MHEQSFFKVPLIFFPYFIFCKYGFFNWFKDIWVIFLIKAVRQQTSKGPLGDHLSPQERSLIEVGFFYQLTI